MGFDKDFDKRTWKRLGNVSIFFYRHLTSFHYILFLFKHIFNTHTYIPQLFKKKKKKGPEILVTPHVVFICEK